jgi:hypothetical protein
MQVRRMYMSKNRSRREMEYVEAANRSLDAGFHEFAYINAQMAALERGEDPNSVDKL